MTGAELLAQVRELLRDKVEPYLWSNTVIYRYLNEAQRIMAERSYCIVNDEDYTVDLEADTRSYSLDNEVLFVFGARLDGDTDPLRAGFLPISSAFFAGSTGKPTRYTTTGGRGKIAFTPTPDDNYTVNLVVALRPTTTISATSSPEIDEDYQIYLADYAAARCLLTSDVDGLNIDSANQFGASFTKAVNELKGLIYRYRLGPDPNVVLPRST